MATCLPALWSLFRRLSFLSCRYSHQAIDALVADPFGYLGDVLPDLAYTYGEVGSGLKALLDMLASSGLDLGVDLPEDFSGIVSMVGA